MSYKENISEFKGLLDAIRANISFADYEGFDESHIHQAVSDMGEANFGKILVCCVALRNSTAEKKLKKRAAAVVKLLRSADIRPRADSAKSITLMRIAVCYPVEYIRTRLIFDEAMKLDSLPDVKYPVFIQDLIFANYFKSIGEVDIGRKINDDICRICKMQGGANFMMLPNMKKEHVDVIGKEFKAQIAEALADKSAFK